MDPDVSSGNFLFCLMELRRQGEFSRKFRRERERSAQPRVRWHQAVSCVGVWFSQKEEGKDRGYRFSLRGARS